MRNENKELRPHPVEKEDIRDVVFNTVSGYIIGRVSSWFLPSFIPLQAKEIRDKGIKSLEYYALNSSATAGYFHGVYNILSDLAKEPNNWTNYIPFMTNAIVGLSISVFNRTKNLARSDQY